MIINKDKIMPRIILILMVVVTAIWGIYKFIKAHIAQNEIPHVVATHGQQIVQKTFNWIAFLGYLFLACIAQTIFLIVATAIIK